MPQENKKWKTQGWRSLEEEIYIYVTEFVVIEIQYLQETVKTKKIEMDSKLNLTEDKVSEIK